MIQQLLAPSPPLAGRLLLSASMLELPLLLLLLLVHSLPELESTHLSLCREKHFIHTEDTCHQRLQRTASIYNNCQITEFWGKISTAFSDMRICLSRHEHTANVRTRITSFSKHSNIYRDCPDGICCRRRDMSEDGMGKRAASVDILYTVITRRHLIGQHTYRIISTYFV